MRNMQPSERSKRSSEAQAFAGLIVRERNPENLEFPFSALNSFVTSNEQFFVRSHFGVPKLERRRGGQRRMDWRASGRRA